MVYSIIGTGAIGGYYGAMLARAGKEVHFLLHSDYEYVVENGLQVNSCVESFHLDKPQVYSRTSDMPKSDIIIVALKSTNNHLLAQLLPPLLKEDTLVLLIQNGIGIEEDLQKLFPSTSLAAGLAFICSAKTKPGTIDHQCYGSLNIGNYSCGSSAYRPIKGGAGDGKIGQLLASDEKIDLLLADLGQSKIKASRVEYLEARWKKAVWNMPFNGLTVALDTQTNNLLDNEATSKLVYDMMIEVVGAAKALGVTNIDSSFADKMIAMTRAMIPYSPSMKLDYDFHRPMEINYLYSRPIAEARKADFDMPRLAMLEAQLKFKGKIYEDG